MRAFSTLRILPRIGRIACVRGSRPLLAEPPAESPSTMKISHSRGSVDWQSESLPGSPPPPSRPLRRVGLARLAGRDPRRGRLDRLLDDVARLARVAVEPVAELLGDDALHERLRLGVAELGLRLALELRLAELDRDDGGQALADVVAGEVLVALLEDALLPRVSLTSVGQRRAEALLVGAALVGVDRVRVGVDALAVRRRPLHRDLDRQPALDVLGLEVDDLGVDRLGLLGGVEVLDVVDQAAVVPEGHRGRRAVLVGVVGALVDEGDLQALVEERQLLEAAAQRLEVEDGASRRSRLGQKVMVVPVSSLGLALRQRRRRHADA